MVLRQEHKAGEKGFVDWAGATMPVQDPDTGEIWQASLFVMVLGASSYTYAEATRDQQLSAWISSHIHAFEYFGGVPRLLVPDNPRTGVSRACRYDPDLYPPIKKWRCTTAWVSCRRVPIVRGTKPRSKSVYKSSNAGSWRRCVRQLDLAPFDRLIWPHPAGESSL